MHQHHVKSFRLNIVTHWQVASKTLDVAGSLGEPSDHDGSKAEKTRYPKKDRGDMG